MATRLFFHENIAAPITPAVDAGWESSAAPFASKAMMPTTDLLDTLTTVAGFSSTAAQDRCHRQLISPPMVAGIVFTIAVTTFKCYVQVLESAANDNIRSRLGVRVLSRDGGTVRATLLTIADYSTAAEWNIALRNKSFADGDVSLASYTTVAGDRLVVEVGHSDVAGSSISSSSRWGSAQTTDLGENETSTSTTERPWFETSATLTFESTQLFIRGLTPARPPTAGEKSTVLPVASGSSAGLQEFALDLALGPGRVQATAYTLAQTAHQDVFFLRATSAALAAQTIAAGALTFTGHVDADPNTTPFFTLSVYVWRPGTGAVVGFLYDSDTPLGAKNIGRLFSFAGAAVTAAAYDVLVVEMWSHLTQADATSYGMAFYYDGPVAGFEGQGGDEGPFLELPQVLSFQLQAPRAMHSYRQRRAA